MQAKRAPITRVRQHAIPDAVRGRACPSARALRSMLDRRLDVVVLEIPLLTGNHDVEIIDAEQAVN